MKANIQGAIERWLNALHATGQEAFVEAACAHDAVIERYGWDGQTRPSEVFEGHQAIGEWLARSPEGTRFHAGEAALEDEVWVVPYTVTLQDFRNHGTWRVLLDDAGLVRELQHRPEPLPPPDIPLP